MSQERQQAPLRAAYTEALTALRMGRAVTAERQLRAIQASAPGDLDSLRLLGGSLLYQDKVTEAVETLERVAAAAPEFWAARADLAHAYRTAGKLDAALREVRTVVSAAPELVPAWLAYGDVLVELEKYPDAKFAYECARRADPEIRRIEHARDALAADDHKTAEPIFRDILRSDPAHVAALCGLAAVSLTVSRAQDAVRLLKHALKQSAHLPLAWRGLSQALLALGDLPEAEAAARRLLRIESENPNNWVQLATVYARLMRQQDALAAFEEAARRSPGEVRLRLSIGHLNKTLGRRRECEQAYKQCLEMDPSMGEAYWSLADLKNYVFSDAEIASMLSLMNGEDGDDQDQAYVHFALGRAFEHKKDYAAAFDHYATGNRRRRKTVPFDIEAFENKTRRVRECFDPAFFASRSGSGHPDPSPIFIIGLPRSGSTLVEQILASHSCVEGTFELPNLLSIVREFDHADAVHDAYPEIVRAASPEHLANLGRRYIEETAPLRGARPYFIDKMPNNFSHVGLIQAILPRAVIIDARRHPMDACFSTYKQHFAEGQSFSYDLEDLGRYYRCYLSLMDHWDAVLPGKVLRLQYEVLVREPDPSIRRLLAHCGLEFEPGCLAFHETKRAVRTASAEQVRQPLYTSGMGYWKHFESQLEPLRRALGDALERFPNEN
ncbi:MAG: sulfotransferase [Steroidobacteraceae bacterium]|jgi:tetratricopeptide (TPR) repeat protein